MDPVVFNPNQPEKEESSDGVTVVPVTNKSTKPAVAPTPAVSPVATPPAADLTASSTPKKSKKGILLLVILLILLIAGGVLAYFRVNDLAKPAVTADQAPKEVAELRIGSTYAPFTKLYPDPSFTAGSFGPTMQLYEGLTGFDNRDTVVPLLAESWTTPDDMTWIFKLKPNVKFHDGKAMTAEDVQKSIDRAIKDKNTISLLVTTIDSVEVHDADHIMIKTKTPDPILLNKLAYLFVQGETKMNGALTGTGAYMFDPDVAPTDKDLHLVAFDDYHNGKPAVRKVVFQGYDDEAALIDAVKQGKVDISDILYKSGGDLTDVDGYSKTTLHDGFIQFIGINSKDTKLPTSKLAVRQALLLSIDQKAFMTASGGVGEPASQLTIKDNFGYNPDLKPFTRDVAKAKALLTAAGYPKGVTIKISFEGKAGNTAGVEELKKEAAEAGITIVADPTSDFNGLLDNVTAGKYQTYLLSSASALIDSYDLFAFNVYDTSYNNPAFYSLLDKSNAEFDVAKRKVLLQQISKLMVDDGAVIPLYETQSTYFARTNLNYTIDTAAVLPGGYIRTISAK